MLNAERREISKQTLTGAEIWAGSNLDEGFEAQYFLPQSFCRRPRICNRKRIYPDQFWEEEMKTLAHTQRILPRGDTIIGG